MLRRHILGCLVSFFSKNFRFWFIILQNRIKQYVKILTKIVILHFELWHKRLENSKMSLNRLYENNKFCILNKTKHDFENFSILRLSLAFYILHSMGTPQIETDSAANMVL